MNLPTEVTTDVVCPGCACACDDLEIHVRNGVLERVEPECALAEEWFFKNATVTRTAPRIEGLGATFDSACQRAAELLSNSKSPLVYGLSRSATAGQQAAVGLAEHIGAVVDTTASLCHGPSILAMQTVGESTCSLGEVRNRCDLVVFWGCNPAESHPRHAERYSAFAKGLLVPNGRSDRTIVFVGDESQAHRWRLDAKGAEADRVVAIDSGCDFEAITSLRMLVNGQSLDDSAGLGADLEQLKWLANALKSCRIGVFFFGLGLTGKSFEHPTEDRTGHANVENLLRLTTELNAHTRFYARRMRLQGDVSGADSVLCWRTGFPFSVSLSRGYPRYNPGEYSAHDLLERGEVDACVLVGGETLTAFSDAAMQRLCSIPTVVLDYPASKPLFEPTVEFVTSPYGLTAPGTIYRMDETPLPLTPTLSTQLPTDEDVLLEIHARLRSSAGG